jgi:hypothetical protein
VATLPCHHQRTVIDQVRPTIDLLRELDTLHPEILIRHGIQPIDYHGSLVFRSAIESIRGTFIASSTMGREALVGDILENLKQRNAIMDYKHTGRGQRYDFELALQTDVYAALEVKGGEGNSINISDRPLWAREFGVWCHLDGAIVNQPAHGAHAIISRITNEMIRRNKAVDVVFFKDILCGTRTRPCPKYPGREESMGLMTAPDVFLFPQRLPVYMPDHPDQHDPNPPVHSLASLQLPRLILGLFGVKEPEYPQHVWEVHVEIEALADGRQRRLVNVMHQDRVVSTSKSRPWQPTSERR